MISHRGELASKEYAITEGRDRKKRVGYHRGER
jgi:hypothetical protein